MATVHVQQRRGHSRGQHHPHGPAEREWGVRERLQSGTDRQVLAIVSTAISY